MIVAFSPSEISLKKKSCVEAWCTMGMGACGRSGDEGMWVCLSIPLLPWQIVSFSHQSIEMEKICVCWSSLSRIWSVSINYLLRSLEPSRGYKVESSAWMTLCITGVPCSLRFDALASLANASTLKSWSFLDLKCEWWQKAVGYRLLEQRSWTSSEIGPGV